MREVADVIAELHVERLIQSVVGLDLLLHFRRHGAFLVERTARHRVRQKERGHDHDQEDGDHFGQSLEDVEEHRGEASVG